MRHIIFCALFISMHCFAADDNFAIKAMDLIQKDAQHVLTLPQEERDKVLAAVRICFPEEFYKLMINKKTTNQQREQLNKIVNWKQSYYCYIEFRPYYQ